jgi:glutathione S-transferase
MLILFGHPFSSYTWKALIALYEEAIPFEFRNIAGNEHPQNEAAFLAHWPVGKFPLLVDDGMAVMESSIIVEHVAPNLIPGDADSAREVRMVDRIFDNHVMTQTEAIVAEHLPFITPKPDPARIGRARDGMGAQISA